MVRPPACPVCERELPPGAAGETLFPFCSVRCRQIDLYRWLTGKYAIVDPLDPERLAHELDSRQHDETGAADEPG